MWGLHKVREFPLLTDQTYFWRISDPRFWGNILHIGLSLKDKTCCFWKDIVFNIFECFAKDQTVFSFFVVTFLYFLIIILSEVRIAAAGWYQASSQRYISSIQSLTLFTTIIVTSIFIISHPTMTITTHCILFVFLVLLLKLKKL